MKLATWNVNSIRAREERLVRWLAANQPDVLCLQELKVTDDAFPMLAIQSVGYHAAVHGQKTYNGVAILSRAEPTEVERGFGDGGDTSLSRERASRCPALPWAAPRAPQASTAEVPRHRYSERQSR